MWTMCHIYYTNRTQTYTMYCNLHTKVGSTSIKLAINRKEMGLHYNGGGKGKSVVNRNSMMDSWKEGYEQFPDKVVKYAYNGVML